MSPRQKQKSPRTLAKTTGFILPARPCITIRSPSTSRFVPEVGPIHPRTAQQPFEK